MVLFVGFFDDNWSGYSWSSLVSLHVIPGLTRKLVTKVFKIWKKV